jgi:DNA polymerase (family X)
MSGAPTAPPMDRLSIARAVREIGARLRLQGENPFRARAYERGAQALEELQQDLGALVEDERLTEVRGIGPALAGTITELYRTRRSSMLERLQAEMPPGALELARVRSLSLKKIGLIQQALGVEDLGGLEAACQAGRVRELRGFGPRTEQRLLEEVRRVREGGGLVLLHRALAAGERLLAHLRRAPGVLRADLAGAVRRRQETVSRLPFVATGPAADSAIEGLLSFPQVAPGARRGDRTVEARLAGGLEVSVEWVPPAEYAPALLRLTGSPAHLARLEQQARERGMELSAEALRRDGGVLDAADEAALYAHLGLPYVPPELREDAGEIEAARSGELPADLVTAGDIQGMVHCHTRFSDGRNTVLQMARAAEARGMRYITITDHSPAASYAGGLSLPALRAQWEEIDRAQEQVGIRILRGTESDILADGSLDYPDDVLERFDVIVASIHNRFHMDEDEMTRRLVRALRLPVFKIWGHARGRLIGRRPPFACRMEEVLDAAAGSRAAVEVNGDPHRLDMEPAWIRPARDRGLRFVISVDAHSVEELGNLRYGVDMARRGWLRRSDVLNTLPVDGFRQAVRPS